LYDTIIFDSSEKWLENFGGNAVVNIVMSLIRGWIISINHTTLRETDYRLQRSAAMANPPRKSEQSLTKIYIRDMEQKEIGNDARDSAPWSLTALKKLQDKFVISVDKRIETFMIKKICPFKDSSKNLYHEGIGTSVPTALSIIRLKKNRSWYQLKWVFCYRQHNFCGASD